MTKIFFTAVIAFSLNAAYAQSKKEQIGQLTFLLDSLSNVIANERNLFKAQISELNSANKQQQNDLETLRTDVIHLKKQLEVKQLDLTEKQADIDSLRAEITRINTLLKTTTSAYELLKASPHMDFMITDTSVGLFKLNASWQNLAQNYYKYNFVQGYGICIDGCCDGGFVLGKNITRGTDGLITGNASISIGAITFDESQSKSEHKNNPNVFFVSTENCSGWYWKDKTNYIIVYSEAFKTKEGIGVGTTLEKLKEFFGEVIINIGSLEEDPNAVQVQIASCPNIQFVLDEDDAIGGYEKLSSLRETATIKDFKSNTMIKRLIIGY
jgi:hypothetical protein